jgi:hypothetical protein
MDASGSPSVLDFPPDNSGKLLFSVEFTEEVPSLQGKTDEEILSWLDDDDAESESDSEDEAGEEGTSEVSPPKCLRALSVL